MKYKRWLVLFLPVAAVLTLLVVASAQAPGVTYQLIATIPIPPDSAGRPLTSWDITWVDPGTGRFYITNRTTVKGEGRIDVIDTQANKFLYSIPGMVGPVAGPPNKSGPNGVVAIPQLNQLYVGDGDSTVKVIDLAQKKVIATINTGGLGRADELGYDPLDHIIAIANASDSPPFMTFISADTQKILGQYTYPPYQAGLEQPVWNKVTQRFYVTVPAVTVMGVQITAGTVDVFNPLTPTKRESSFTIDCSPAGLVMTPNQKFMTSCGSVLGARGGHLANVPVANSLGANGDQIWYNPGDHRVYFGSAVMDADTNQVIATLPTVATCGTLDPTFACVGSRVNPAVDSETNHVFTPVATVGIKVWAATATQ